MAQDFNLPSAHALAQTWAKTGAIDAKVSTLGIVHPNFVVGEVIAQDQARRFRAGHATPDELLAVVLGIAATADEALIAGFCRELQKVVGGR